MNEFVINSGVQQKQNSILTQNLNEDFTNFRDSNISNVYNRNKKVVVSQNLNEDFGDFRDSNTTNLTTEQTQQGAASAHLLPWPNITQFKHLTKISNIFYMHMPPTTVVLRYVNDIGEPIERFMTFHSIDGHTAEYLSSSIVDLFKNWNLNIKKCVGHSFDNASNMAGKYTGVQARIKNISPMADFVPCAAHSLNLVGVNSIESCTQAVNYFGLVQAKTKNTYILKPHSETRWLSNANAVQALQNDYNIILSVLNNIYENENEKPQYRVESKNLLKQLKKKETAVFTCIWNSILSRINESSIQLQSTTRNFSIIIPIYNLLIIYIQSVRGNFNLYEEKSSCFNVATDYTLLRKKKLLKLNKRKSKYQELGDIFGFLYRSESNSCETKLKIKKCLSSYFDEIEIDDFFDEFIQFQAYNESIDDVYQCKQNPHNQLKYLYEMNIQQTFPNVETILSIFLSIPCTNCSSERALKKETAMVEPRTGNCEEAAGRCKA
ncbi:zinc finger MYM-type protein 1-like [Aphis craccivora]|uniref:Zinc finger MYM-type protein 1-like n=1 Tax=Aphis craccivora TaxID=307492 RepID=A0A6G0Y8K8_APHCR|nr:zinc finger MYM-type protein 1-like [Aphis craccivora]